MTNRPTLPALAFALCSTALFAGGIARAEDAMKPADPMAAEKMKDCMDKAAMETDAMKKDEATKTCDAMETAK
ncbi:MAG: hypothetical protein E5X53_21040 [Mesorhizobium sp.]|uniref:hypothetical protein n=1 Tax=Mesorhizobium sp. TaxID=1871066 RepID=UPI000FE6F814|nr:hypothetical protein [Mesorhizobium sp.]RWM16701.1 MAG: hypothetical protein EOR73_22080 [Mesorhizobium sp.]TIP72194.1 MAG: hypothetical protein E5X55_19485 [Mesorhizobium sp.]TIQ08968.1 MAG: hypothetical protein E5X57_20625 [Mesorhizobium sp.]TIR50212.1 MAG: hypothetical protein E5X53_21040 [Mesorhizobium sp.]TJV96435.1 MAG: hypothetical protein E5X52_18600 [Mesorhizobium sp.]